MARSVLFNVVVLVLCLVLKSEAARPRIDSSLNSTEPTVYYEVPENESDWRLKYCGSQPLPPWKDLMCKKFCDEGLCRNFYCACADTPKEETKCHRAALTGKCGTRCRNSNMLDAYVCSFEPRQYYCICV